ncbi:hypothetical protein E2C01_082314 [Portunus trituberculatus]|uniref:Uncharacterized protein n=1 Tax=Portunus trituberculatus TaxID=210409 RepID=A0A5B7IU78_PORTR|nr:hypothetical protein [Portunus trituberculatus]
MGCGAARPSLPPPPRRAPLIRPSLRPHCHRGYQ